MKLESIALHHGYDSDKNDQKSATTPIYQTSGFTIENTKHGADLFDLKVEGNIYTRIGNPTNDVLEKRVAEMEGGIAALSLASGMAAISNTLGTYLKSGDRVVSIKDSYGGTNVIFNEFLPPLNIDVSLCETNDHEQIKTEIAKGCKVLYLETPTNPTIKITDPKIRCNTSGERKPANKAPAIPAGAAPTAIHFPDFISELPARR